MTTRISDAERLRTGVGQIQSNREKVAKLQAELSSGRRVDLPGDDAANAATIAQLRATDTKYASELRRVATLESFLNFQDGVIGQAGDLLTRAKELAAQGGNEANGTSERALLAQEVFQLRSHEVDLE